MKPAPARASGGADLADVRGQLLARRALEIASAGGHNLLLVGPPGAGKTMIARRVPGILPLLTFEEALEATAVHSVAGLLPPGAGLLVDRPFRAPHHTISEAALVGGGSQPRPGEVSVAHHGVLFLDEMLEFSRHVLEVLRQPLEEGRVTIARAARTAVFPARFMLVAAMNPCPCGFLAIRHARVPVHAAADRAVSRSALGAAARPSRFDCRSARRSGRGTGRRWQPASRRRVCGSESSPRGTASANRYADEGIGTNAELTPALMTRYCALDEAAYGSSTAPSVRMSLSARGYDRVRKVARTIADLAGEPSIQARHLAEALQFRLV